MLQHSNQSGHCLLFSRTVVFVFFWFGVTFLNRSIRCLTICQSLLQIKGLSQLSIQLRFTLDKRTHTHIYRGGFFCSYKIIACPKVVFSCFVTVIIRFWFFPFEWKPMTSTNSISGMFPFLVYNTQYIYYRIANVTAIFELDLRWCGPHTNPIYMWTDKKPKNRFSPKMLFFQFLFCVCLFRILLVKPIDFDRSRFSVCLEHSTVFEW